MRQIKFRGRKFDGTIVYGDLLHDGRQPKILDEDDGDFYEVDPESVAQLVGVDSNGKGVYEGDTVVLNSPDYHIEYTAHLSGYGRQRHLHIGRAIRQSDAQGGTS